MTFWSRTAGDKHVAVGPRPHFGVRIRPDGCRHLANKYSEAPVAVGMAENGGVIEVLTSTEGGTWTIIITMPDGTSCMVAAGEDWEQLPKIAAKAKGPGA